MPGTTTFDGISVDLSRAATRVEVYRYTGYDYEKKQPSRPEDIQSIFDSSTDQRLQLLPNVNCVMISRTEGAVAGHAKFRYRLDNSGAINVDGDWPTSVEEVFGSGASGNYVVSMDDRLCVIAYTADGSPRILFDGFVELPSATIKGDTQDVSFIAHATPKRCFDYPLWAGVLRNEDNEHDRTSDYPVDGVAIHFNPMVSEGACRPNATDEDDDGRTGFLGQSGSFLYINHAVFLDPDFCEDQKIGRFWTVAMAARYILARGNNHQCFVLNPGVKADKTFPEVLVDFLELDFLLDSWEPTNESIYDPSNPDMISKKPIILKDVDVTGLCWPEALAKVIEPHGFRFVFRLALRDGFPCWALDFYRQSDYVKATVKYVGLQPDGSDLDPGLTNMAELNLTRDVNDSVNEYYIKSAPSRHEANFILAPLFDIATGDSASASALKEFIDTNDPTKVPGPKYREWGFDETGEGHWNFSSGGRVYSVASLTSILGGPKTTLDGRAISDVDREKNYRKRRRKPSSRLLTRDGADDTGPEEDEYDEGSEQDGKLGKRAKAQLFLSTDYGGSRPSVWDGSGTWYLVKGWKLLEDRIGIRITATNPDAWDCGNTKINFGVAASSSGGKIRGVTALSKAGETRFILMLCTVIEGDDLIAARALRRPSSPSRWAVRRYINGDGKYRRDIIHAKSSYNTTAKDIISRDDSVAAKADAVARRMANEMPPYAGHVTIPRITNSYAIGHRIGGVIGRDISLRMNGSPNTGEGPIYPLVIGIEYNFEGGQSTKLILGDSRGSDV